MQQHSHQQQQEQNWHASDPMAYQQGDEQSVNEPPALPDGWSEHFDPSSGLPYYFNAADGTTTWDRPAADLAPDTQEEEKTDIADEDNEGEELVQSEVAEQDVEPSVDSFPIEQDNNLGNEQSQGDQVPNETMTGGQDHEADALTDFRRTDEAVEQENRWRDANGWNNGLQPTDARLQQQKQQKPWGVTHDTQESSNEQPPTGWGMSDNSEQEAQGSPPRESSPPPNDQLPYGWGMKDDSVPNGESQISQGAAAALPASGQLSDPSRPPLLQRMGVKDPKEPTGS